MNFDYEWEFDFGRIVNMAIELKFNGIYISLKRYVKKIVCLRHISGVFTINVYQCVLVVRYN